MNLKRLAYKLQTALLQQGMKVKINQFQSYSEQNKRMITKYVLTIPIESGNQIKNKTVLESYRNWQNCCGVMAREANHKAKEFLRVLFANRKCD